MRKKRYENLALATRHNVKTKANLVASFLLAGKISMIPDNAKIHHAKLLAPFLEQMQGRLELIFLHDIGMKVKYIFDIHTDIEYHIGMDVKRR